MNEGPVCCLVQWTRESTTKVIHTIIVIYLSDNDHSFDVFGDSHVKVENHILGIIELLLLKLELSGKDCCFFRAFGWCYLVS